MISDRRNRGRAARRLARLGPVALAVTVAYALARFAPYWVVGVNRWLWWLGVFGIANTCLLLADSVRHRLMRRLDSGQR